MNTFLKNNQSTIKALLIPAIILSSSLVMAKEVPMSALNAGDTVLVSNDGSHFTEMFYLESCFIKTDKGFESRAVIDSSIEPDPNTWQTQYTKTMNGDLVVSDVIAILPPPEPRVYQVPKTQLIGFLTRLSNIINTKEDPTITKAKAKASAFKAVGALFDEVEESSAELEEIRRIVRDEL